MSTELQRDRLLSLLEFAQQSARLRSKPATSLTRHGLFSLYEHQIQGLPGIRVNVDAADCDDEIWLTIKRLHETTPPAISGALLQAWVQTTSNPNEVPRLHEAIEGAILGAAEIPYVAAAERKQDKPAVDPSTLISLSEYEHAERVRAELLTYVETKWHPWAEEEKLRRKTIRLYAQLFTLKQQLDGGMIQAPLELVWGLGIGIWNFQGTAVSYPLLGQLVEISLNPDTTDLEIRPRDIDAQIDVDWYASVDNPGVIAVEKAAKEFLSNATATFSPFDRGTFEPLLRMAVINLDAEGMYWPDEVSADYRLLPKPDDKLKVTDTWVLFARPRTNNALLQDLEELKKQVEVAAHYPPAIAAIVTDPDTANPIIELPIFRGVSACYHAEHNTSGKKARDLYFPKAFNEEQVRIVQLLDVSDGVVVQGPPGTGKTHTIANVICHYLAEGKRVLVTSMKDPALAVLREQLPAEIRPLAISLLTNEKDGMKQFEHAIHKIASEVQIFDRARTIQDISHLETCIDGLHSKIFSIDQRIGDWAKRNLTAIALDGEEIDPAGAARDVVAGVGQFEWIQDALGIDPDFAPQFSDSDVVRLRNARRALGKDIEYLDASLPQLVDFPETNSLLEIHQAISTFEKLKNAVENGDVPLLLDSSEETLAATQHLLTRIESLRDAREEIARANRPWTVALRDRVRQTGGDDLLATLEILGTELEQATEHHKVFLNRPVTTPPDLERDPILLQAIDNLSEGKRPFALRRLFRTSEQRDQLRRIRVLGHPVVVADDWKHVAEHLALLESLRELALRWNALASELNLEAIVGEEPQDGLAAANYYKLYLKVRAVVRAEDELCALASRIFPEWRSIRELIEDAKRLPELEQAVRHHLTKNRLAHACSFKLRYEQVLDGRTGRIAEDLREFFNKTLGDPLVTQAVMKAEWSALMGELSRVLGLQSFLATVRDVCSKIEASGAPKYAAALTSPIGGTVDALLPDTWRKAWRLRRLATHLDSIDAHDELKKLAKQRSELENQLSNGYRDAVVKRTWLKLAENASPRIRAALQAYLAAIQKIGKGTGKRAMRYRSDARIAASQANSAVPCWIMAHFRVSESLPPELGCFDLVVIDEASQSDFTALPCLLRAKKILIVGDDKQVSPEGVGLEEEKICSLINRFLDTQVVTYRQQMSPERSIYDLFKVVFAKSAVMLKEHFRCVSPIIEYSKREFYNHELRPLRVPKVSERLDPPLIDVVVQDGYRRGDLNFPEARFIADEIRAITIDPAMEKRSIGVVSLLGDKQALKIWELLMEEIGPEVTERHSIACGDARTFQGKERDIIFLSMVSAPNELGAPLSRDTFAQRFNVAASRARDRMYLVRSVELDHLSKADRLRRSLIEHFAAPFAQDEVRVEDLRKLCESAFEREIYDELTQRGYRVTPQVRVGQYRIDMVVEGHNDTRLGVECDGDKYHGADRWADDMQRQRVLERAGWMLWRCFASAFIRRRTEVLNDLLRSLDELGIDAIGAAGAPKSLHTEHRTASPLTAAISEQDGPIAIENPELAFI